VVIGVGVGVGVGIGMLVVELFIFARYFTESLSLIV